MKKNSTRRGLAATENEQTPVSINVSERVCRNYGRWRGAVEERKLARLFGACRNTGPALPSIIYFRLDKTFSTERGNSIDFECSERERTRERLPRRALSSHAFFARREQPRRTTRLASFCLCVFTFRSKAKMKFSFRESDRREYRVSRCIAVSTGFEGKTTRVEEVRFTPRESDIVTMPRLTHDEAYC